MSWMCAINDALEKAADAYGFCITGGANKDAFTREIEMDRARVGLVVRCLDSCFIVNLTDASDTIHKSEFNCSARHDAATVLRRAVQYVWLCALFARLRKTGIHLQELDMTGRVIKAELIQHGSEEAWLNITDETHQSVALSVSKPDFRWDRQCIPDYTCHHLSTAAEFILLAFSDPPGPTIHCFGHPPTVCKAVSLPCKREVSVVQL